MLKMLLRYLIPIMYQELLMRRNFFRKNRSTCLLFLNDNGKAIIWDHGNDADAQEVHQGYHILSQIYQGFPGLFYPSLLYHFCPILFWHVEGANLQFCFALAGQSLLVWKLSSYFWSFFSWTKVCHATECGASYHGTTFCQQPSRSA